MLDINFVDYPLGETLAGRSIIIKSSGYKKSDLINYLALELEFPDYFSVNWDSFEECLRDLSWIKQNCINLVHTAIPLENDNELSTYLSIISSASNKHNSIGIINLQIYFPVKYKKKILSLAI
ncbi:MAG: barstar family protein [Leptospira sp.]|nr:barstar family protein [Leptospira sp.]